MRGVEIFKMPEIETKSSDSEAKSNHREFMEMLRDSYELRHFLNNVLNSKLKKIENIEQDAELEERILKYQKQVLALSQNTEIAVEDKEKLIAISKNLEDAFNLSEPGLFSWIAGCLDSVIDLLKQKLSKGEVEQIQATVHLEEISKQAEMPTMWTDSLYEPTFESIILKTAIKAGRAKTEQKRAEILEKGKSALQAAGFEPESDSEGFESTKTVTLYRQMREEAKVDKNGKLRKTGESAKHQVAFDIAIGRQIGKGGFSEVFEGRDSLTGRKLALRKSDPRVAEKFLRDGRAASYEGGVRKVPAERTPDGRIIGPILWGLAVGGDGVVYDVLDLVEADDAPAPNLMQHIVESDMHCNEFANLVESMLKRVSYQAENGIVLVDLKTQNLVVEDGVVKLIDQDLSKPFAEYIQDLEDGTVVASPFYVAPEVFFGKPKTLQENDFERFSQARVIYALSFIIEELWTGDIQNKNFTKGNNQTGSKKSLRECALEARAILSDDSNAQVPQFTPQADTPQWLVNLVSQMRNAHWEERPPLSEVVETFTANAVSLKNDTSLLYKEYKKRIAEEKTVPFDQPDSYTKTVLADAYEQTKTLRASLEASNDNTPTMEEETIVLRAA